MGSKSMQPSESRLKSLHKRRRSGRREKASKTKPVMRRQEVGTYHHPWGRPVPTQLLCKSWLTSQTHLPFLFIAEHGVTWHGVSLQAVGVICLVSPPKLLCTPHLFTGVAEQDAGKALRLCAHCSAAPKTSLCCYQPCCGHESKPQHYKEN